MAQWDVPPSQSPGTCYALAEASRIESTRGLSTASTAPTGRHNMLLTAEEHAVKSARLPLLLSTLFLSALSIGVSTPAQAEDPVWKPIMDGKTLAGWHKNGLGEWTVEDGAFVGTSHNESLYGHLVSNDKYQEFVVRFLFQCTSGDSGFFIRTEMKEPDKTYGLQIQVGPCGSGTGGIYESYGRGWLQQPSKVQEAYCYREGRWNEMIISAQGPHVTVHVNGFKTADLTDDQIEQKAGVFALQMHSGVVNHTVFKDIAILEQGTIVPRQFLYSDVPRVTPAEDGTLVLDAAAAMTVGPEIRYLPEWAALGAFTDQDYARWPIDIRQPRAYEVYLTWSAPADHAGQSFVFSIGDQACAGTVGDTGSWAAYRTAKLGRVTLAAGSHEAELRPQGEFATQLMNVRQLRLVPVQQ